MTFFGILIKMALRPVPAQSYVVCWMELAWHRYTMAISCN